MNKKYTASFFIKKFKAIPARLWTTGQYHNEETGRRCAIGHCKPPSQNALIDLFHDKGLVVISVNDCCNDQRFPQKTPKARILAALRYIKSKSC